jgi:hypothetical protein
MTHTPRHFTVTDPRTFDGTPYEVAERAVAQTLGLVNVVLDTMPATEKMVLNAELSRQLALGDEPDPHASALRRKLHAVQFKTADVARELEIIRRAAGYDPKNPLR